MAHPNAATFEKPVPVPGHAQPLRVLILDDSEFDARRIKRTLSAVDPNIQVSAVATLTDYYRRLLSDRFDVLIIDYFLPDGDGLTALRMASDHANGDSLASIMVAGENDPIVAEAAKGFGCSSYLHKADLTTQALRKALNLTLSKTVEGDLAALHRLLTPSSEETLDDVEDTIIQPMRPYLMRLVRASRKLQELAEYRGDDILTDVSIEVEHSCDAALALLAKFDTLREVH